MNKAAYLAGVSGLAVIMAAPVGVAAQETATQESGAGKDLYSLEEITVTAQKREESLQDIAVSVSAFSGDTLRKDGIDNLQDIGNRTPGMVFAAFAPGQPEIAIRGIGTKEDGASASDSTVVSVDGVYIAARTAQVFDIFDLERVEVLRGPQGTLYGKNAIAGTVNFVTHKPTAETEMRFRQTVGNYDKFDTGGLISGAVTDNLFAKVSFSRRKHDGFLTNVLPGENFGEQWGEKNTFSWRNQWRWVPSPDLEVILSLDGADDSMGATNREAVGAVGPLHDCGCASDPLAVNEALGGDGDPFTTLADEEGFTERDIWGGYLKVNYDFSGMTLTSITAVRESDYDYLEDSTGLPAFDSQVDLTQPSAGPLLTGAADRGFTFDISDAVQEDAEQFTQEVRLASNSAGPLEWLAGVFYSEEEIERTEEFIFPRLGGPDGNDINTSNQFNDGTSFSVFGQATYDLTADLSLTGGLRYSYDKKEGWAEGLVPQGLGLLIKPFERVDFSESWENVDWRLAVDYRLNDEVLLFANASTGFKSGGFVGSASTAERASTAFDEENATNYEAGFKSDLFNRRLRLNVTAFFTDYNDLQVTRFFQPITSGFGEFITENAGEAESKGVEVEFTGLITRELEVGGSYAYLDATFTNFQGTPSVTADGTITDSGDFDGNRLRQAPEHMVHLFGQYTHTLADDSSIYARLNYRYQSRSFFDPNNNPITDIPGYEIWDGRVAWQSPDQVWEVAAWMKNIGDEEYRTHIFSQRGSRIAFALFGDPRTYGLSVTWNY
ncbi:TonB-dependent receptor [Yunchengibacter salinarum]|uniref:TonB-dependent receptor n=1 Tax=Yunchengibacter salinarum TaxID=3133399 RepID=UPI0035B5C86E